MCIKCVNYVKNHAAKFVNGLLVRNNQPARILTVVEIVLYVLENVQSSDISNQDIKSQKEL